MIHDGLWDAYNDYHMGNTGEVVAERYEVTREQQDQWALESHQQGRSAAIDAGQVHPKEIVPVEVPQRKKDPILFDTDESPRRDTSLEALAKLRPAFKKGGTVTAGNAPGVNDGASAVVDQRRRRQGRQELGLTPRAEIVAYASSGLAPGAGHDGAGCARHSGREAQRARWGRGAGAPHRRLGSAHPDHLAPRAGGSRPKARDRRAVPRRRERGGAGDPAFLRGQTVKCRIARSLGVRL